MPIGLSLRRSPADRKHVRMRAMAFKRWHRKKVQMPFTPFHLGPALFLGLLLFRLVDLPTFLAANVILDLEPLAVLLLDLDYPLHGLFHSFLGGPNWGPGADVP